MDNVLDGKPSDQIVIRVRNADLKACPHSSDGCASRCQRGIILDESFNMDLGMHQEKTGVQMRTSMSIKSRTLE